MLEERYMGPEYNLDELIKLPKNSLGYTYAKLMKTMGFFLTPFLTDCRDRPSVDDSSDTRPL